MLEKEEDKNRPKYFRPLRKSDFILRFPRDIDTEAECDVNFWIINVISNDKCEILYSYNNNCHRHDRSSYIRIKNGEVLFKHDPERNSHGWGSDQKYIIDAYRLYIDKLVEQGLGLDVS